MDAVSQQQARHGGTRHDVARIKGASVAPSSSLPSCAWRGAVAWSRPDQSVAL